MTGAFAVTFSGKSIYISSPAGLLPKSVTWTSAPRTVAKRHSPEKTQDLEITTMIADVGLYSNCGLQARISCWS